MKIIIIEDETLVAEDLYSTLMQIKPDIELQAVLSSVSESIEYFSNHPQPDLIFSDIQLGDGLSFQIFSHIEINVPIVFCTAFDDYAIEAFQTNGIDYILKPYDKNVLDKAIQKYSLLKTALAKDVIQQYDAVMKVLDSYKLQETGTFMIKHRDRYLPVGLDKIAMFYLEDEVCRLYLFSGKIYFIPDTLEEVESKIGSNFFRANRQFLINKEAVLEALEYFPRKLKLQLKLSFDKEIIVSKEKKTKLLKWLNDV
ncbi:LytR/AlgR family response regulator transcription factor [Chryseobacterium polytrichastri]|uniref:Two component transcriptional regulator, LytTR family n=1 Tax=Chryseobacterium polytrichastri TaxID=1302687 RepID=A0A1M6XKN5_9FLAO|nr:LytTR family DNA-binding domain-containing protein [Chryseobacterium polytrichastri]SHL06466.1 two component transcriptional regulator, LytTR family [Chryseobacterium polytrichastri]